jgi:hypothetical protein
MSKYFDDGKSGYCCWDCAEAIECGVIVEEEKPKGYFTLNCKDELLSQHPLWCCPFCGGDFKKNGRMK